MTEGRDLAIFHVLPKCLLKSEHILLNAQLAKLLMSLRLCKVLNGNGAPTYLTMI